MVKKGGKKGGGKGGPKSPKGPKLPKVNEGLHPSEMSKGQLCALIKRLMAELDLEKHEKNLFMFEKQRLYSLWNITMDKLKIMKEDSTMSLFQAEESKKKLAAENNEQSQKLRQQLNEENKNFGLIRLNHCQYMRRVSDELWELENILRESSVAKRAEIRAQFRSQYEILRGLYMNHATQIQQLVHTMSKALRSKEIQVERLFESRREEATAHLKSMDGIIIATKMGHLDTVTESHDKMLLDLKTFFNDMAVNNFAVIGSLHDGVESLKQDSSRLRRALVKAKERYDELVGPLEKMKQELQAIHKRGGDRFLRQTLNEMKRLAHVLGDRRECISRMEVLNEILRQQIETAERERDEIQRGYTKGLLKFQRQASMQGLVMELKRKAAIRDLQLLQAARPNQTGNLYLNMKDLYELPTAIQRNIKEGIREAERAREEYEVETGCKKPSHITRIMKEEAKGLVSKKGTILPPINARAYINRETDSDLDPSATQPPPWRDEADLEHLDVDDKVAVGQLDRMCSKFVKGRSPEGMGAGPFKSRIKYRGPLPSSKVKGVRREGGRSVGYGYYYYDPLKNPGDLSDDPDASTDGRLRQYICSQEAELARLRFADNQADGRLSLPMSSAGSMIAIPRYSNVFTRSGSMAVVSSRSSRATNTDFKEGRHAGPYNGLEANTKSMRRLKSIIDRDKTRMSMVAFAVNE